MTGAPEQLAGAVGDAPGLVVAAKQLLAIQVSLLQVIADDLLELDCAVARVRGDPVGEALVQDRARLLRDSRIRRVADQRVREAEGVVGADGGTVRADELLPHE